METKWPTGYAFEVLPAIVPATSVSRWAGGIRSCTLPIRSTTRRMWPTQSGTRLPTKIRTRLLQRGSGFWPNLPTPCTYGRHAHARTSRIPDHPKRARIPIEAGDGLEPRTALRRRLALPPQKVHSPDADGNPPRRRSARESARLSRVGARSVQRGCARAEARRAPGSR